MQISGASSADSVAGVTVCLMLQPLMAKTETSMNSDTARMATSLSKAEQAVCHHHKRRSSPIRRDRLLPRPVHPSAQIPAHCGPDRRTTGTYQGDQQGALSKHVQQRLGPAAEGGRS